MRGVVFYGPRDVRFEERESPKIVEPTDAIVRISLTCVCGSDLWPYRGLQPINGPTPMGHEYCGAVEFKAGRLYWLLVLTRWASRSARRRTRKERRRNRSRVARIALG